MDRSNEQVQSFDAGGVLTDEQFAQVGHLYLSAADSQCQDRISDMYQAAAANKSAFGMLTTASGIAGSALSAGNSANIASGFAAMFNTLSSNAGSFQEHVNAVFTTNVISGIHNSRSDSKSMYSRTKIEGDLKKLVDSGDESDIAEQARIRGLIERYNDLCTIGEGQDWVQEKVHEKDEQTSQ